MEKVELKRVVIKNVAVVRDGSRGRWVKVQIGRLSVTERDNLLGLITKTVTYNSFKTINCATIECVIWIRCDKSFVSVGDIFYGNVEFSIADDTITQAIELDSVSGDATPTYSWEFPDDRETATNLPSARPKDETFTLLSVAVKTVDVVRTHSGMYICKIQIGRMSESEKHKLESFLAEISAHYGRPHRTPISMVEGGKTVPGTSEPLHTYETYVYTTTRPSTVVDRCDLTFKYVAEKGMILAEVVPYARKSSTSFCGLRGLNWFNVQMEDQVEDTAGEFPKLTLKGVLVTFHRDRPQFCHIGRMFNDERNRIIRTFDTDYAHSLSGEYPSLTREDMYEDDILLRTERCVGMLPGIVYLMKRITFVRRWGKIFIDDFEVSADACYALNPIYFDSWRGRVPQAAEDTRGGADERTDRGTIPEIEKIEFRDPATIVFWSDGTKTVVRCQNGEKYDAEKGIAMAIAKKALGNERDYYRTFIHWMKRYEKKGGKK